MFFKFANNDSFFMKKLEIFNIFCIGNIIVYVLEFYLGFELVVVLGLYFLVF